MNVLRPQARSRWLELAMRALDGLQAGAKTQEIAEALFGDERVRRQIEAGREYILDCTRRAVPQRLHMIGKGYHRLPPSQIRASGWVVLNGNGGKPGKPFLVGAVR